jgi:hypothetical protein
MTVAAQNVAPQAVAAVGQTIFPFAWRCDDSTLVVVFVNDVQDGGFTVQRNADQTATPGGTITRGVACFGGEVVTVERLSPQTQTAALTKYGPFPADTVTSMVDKFIMLSQEAASILGKCVKVARSQLTKFSSVEISTVAAGQALAFIVDPIDATKVKFGLIDVAAYVAQVLNSAQAVQPLRWNITQTVGGTVNFNIAGALVGSSDLYIVTVDGVLQDPASYVISLLGTPQVQFTEAPPLNSFIVVRGFGYAKAVSLQGSVTVARAIQGRVVTNWGAAVNIDASAGSYFEVPATTAIAHAIAAPTNPAVGQEITIKIKVSIGALPLTTWNAVFKMPVWADPANGFSGSVKFVYNGVNWVQSSPAIVNVPN